MKKEEEKQPVNWEVNDPKPPIIHSGPAVRADNSNSVQRDSLLP